MADDDNDIPRFRINFGEKKKVDEDWKKEIKREKAKVKAEEEEAQKAAAAGGGQRAKEPSQLLVNFLAGLVQQTMMQLGQMPNPFSGQREVDLEGAQSTIELMRLLQTRMKGNLHEKEEKLLTDALRELQLLYVSAMQQVQPNPPGAPGAEE